MSNAEMFATCGSAANKSTLKPSGTLNALMAVSASSLAGITLRAPAGGPDEAPPPSCAKAAALRTETIRPIEHVRIGRNRTANDAAQKRGRPSGRPR
jgi:hypothetical protein